MKRGAAQGRTLHRPTFAARARGIASDLRECVGEAEVNRDDLREIARRADALADELEGAQK
ncbi:hypothetical protein [Azospirillum rugosum]|uniref:Uncharacterized protein n=1 Tax=Azospirillum rugosum TaxID=416170 RepID=A0ABS4SEM5_9PROT|nr:hypothetical protein [Azospirillum rugosum]MBP2291024.1 hypothetical protein [Azospirillum rugosum]MDQ0524912.1 hypothetical protein [Azospirillum rugosum]